MKTLRIITFIGRLLMMASSGGLLVSFILEEYSPYYLRISDNTGFALLGVLLFSVFLTSLGTLGQNISELKTSYEQDTI